MKMASIKFKVGDRILAPHYSNGHNEADLPATVLYVKDDLTILIQFDSANYGWWAQGNTHLDWEEGYRKYNKTHRAYWLNTNYGIEKVTLLNEDFISVINSLKKEDATVPDNFKELITEYLTQKAV